MKDNKLKLDEELVRQLLAEDNVTVAEDTSFAIMLERTKNHFDFEITDGWNKNPDMMFYTETTSDGYEVWIATDDDRHPSINEDVYYYESDWLEKNGRRYDRWYDLFTFKNSTMTTTSLKKLYKMYTKSTTMTKDKS